MNLMKIGKSGLKFRIRWWIDTYSDANYVFDRVHRALYAAFEEAGIEMSLDAYDLNVSMKTENQKRVPSDLTDSNGEEN